MLAIVSKGKWVKTILSPALLKWHNDDVSLSANSSKAFILTSWGRDKMAAISQMIFWCLLVKDKFCILIKNSLKFAPKGPIDNNPAPV